MTLTEMQQEVIHKVNHYIYLANEIFKSTFIVPQVDFSLRGTTAGQANARTWTVKINNILLKENYEDMLNNTVGHEVAHLIARKISNYRIKPHGYEWKSVMRRFGLNPERCHKYNIDNARVRTVERIPYKCTGCNKEYNFTKIRHNRVLKGVKYNCGLCRSPLKKS